MDGTTAVAEEPTSAPPPPPTVQHLPGDAEDPLERQPVVVGAVGDGGELTGGDADGAVSAGAPAAPAAPPAAPVASAWPDDGLAAAVSPVPPVRVTPVDVELGGKPAPPAAAEPPAPAPAAVPAAPRRPAPPQEGLSPLDTYLGLGCHPDSLPRGAGGAPLASPFWAPHRPGAAEAAGLAGRPSAPGGAAASALPAQIASDGRLPGGGPLLLYQLCHLVEGDATVAEEHYYWDAEFTPAGAPLRPGPGGPLPEAAGDSKAGSKASSPQPQSRQRPSVTLSLLASPSFFPAAPSPGGAGPGPASSSAAAPGVDEARRLCTLLGANTSLRTLALHGAHMDPRVVRGEGLGVNNRVRARPSPCCVCCVFLSFPPTLSILPLRRAPRPKSGKSSTRPTGSPSR